MKILHTADWHLDTPFSGFSGEKRDFLRRELLKIPETAENPNDVAPSAPKKAVINPASCFSCGCCAEVCPVKAITLDENDTPKPVDQAKCIGCGKCVKVCPAHAISMK